MESRRRGADMVPLLALLALLALSWAPPGAGTETVVVQAPAEVSGFLGDSVTLPCFLKPLEPNAQVTQVTWTRQDPDGHPNTVAVLHPQRGPSLSERLQFVGADPLDASLNVSGLRVEDEANYSCQFATFPRGSGRAETRLRVLAKPQSTAEAQEVLLTPSTGLPVPMARCVSTGGRPPARVSWSLPLEDSANSTNNTQVPGTVSGTYTIISLLTLVPSSKADGSNVTCRVEHESLKEPLLLPVTLAVRYPPEVSISGYDGNWYVGQSNVTLHCEARGNPEPRGYTWSTTAGSLPASAVAQGTQLRISTVDQSINATTFICRVTNTLGTSQEEQTILVKDPEVSHWKVDDIIGVVVAVVVAVVAVLGVAFHCKRSRRCGRDRSRPSVNGDVSYSVVADQINSPVDEPTEITR